MVLSRRSGRRALAYTAALGLCIAAVIAVTTAFAGYRDHAWSDVASPFNSSVWWTGSTGTHTFYRYSCSDNHPYTTYTATFTLYHQRGGLPDENEGVMQSYACTSTNRSGGAYSDETENHYWKLTFNYDASWIRLSGTGRTYYP